MSLATSNIFSALDTKKKKKSSSSSSKSKDPSEKKKKHTSKSEKAAEAEPAPAVQPQQLSISNWADDDDDDFENDIAALPEGWDEVRLQQIFCRASSPGSCFWPCHLQLTASPCRHLRGLLAKGLMVMQIMQRVMRCVQAATTHAYHQRMHHGHVHATFANTT